ncbi:MAG: lactate 2-monooxygenase, partial [Actinobacteria bacterium]
MAAIGYGRQRQADIYLAGVRGRKPRVPQNAAALERAARRSMSKEGFAYIAGGAGLETTMTANRAAFERVRIVPRMLRGPATRRLEVELFGRTLPAPLLVAPIGVLEMAHHEGDLAVARAAAAEGVPMIFSSQASKALEDCAAAMENAARWFQLYMSTSDELVRSFVSRAERAGCEAIVVTLDTTMLGWRLRDLDLGYL